MKNIFFLFVVTHHRVIILASLYSRCNLVSFCQFFIIASVSEGILLFCQFLDWSLQTIRWLAVPVKTLHWLPSGDPDSSPWLTKLYMMWFLPYLLLLIWCSFPFYPLISSYPGHIFIFPLAKPFLTHPFPVSGILFLQDYVYMAILFCVFI